jgi:hypothetical protein
VRISFATDAIDGPYTSAEHFDFSATAPFGDGNHWLRCNCADTKARYVKLSFDGGSLPGNATYDHKWMLDEVQVYGHEPQSKDE